MKKLIKLLATCFGLGYAPVAQGTIASMAGLIIYLLIHTHTTLYLPITIICLIVGFLVSHRAERLFGGKDPKEIVIDDLCGVLLVFIYIPFKPLYIIVGFISYRLLDICKLYPINKLEKLPAGWGIMLDDIAAGLYANIILHVLSKII